MAESTNTPRYQTNTFIGGMNTDTDDSLLASNQYRLAKNLRLTTTTHNSTGSLHNIDGCFKSVNWSNYSISGNILKIDSIRDTGIVITSDSTKWYVYTFDYGKGQSDPVYVNSVKKILEITGTISESISTVTRYEDSNDIKIYIADGVSPIRVLNLYKAMDYYTTYHKPYYTTELSVSIYKSVLMKAPIVSNYGSGMLKAGIIQFGYQLFDRNGIETEISSLSDAISLYNYTPGTTDNISGTSKDYSSGVSVSISISDIPTQFEYIKIIAVYYDENGQLPKIYVLNNDTVNKSSYQYIVSTLDNNISTYTVEEFNSITGTHFVPSILESKNNYLFASNVKYIDTTFDIGDTYDARSFAYDVSGNCTFKDGTSLTSWATPSSYDSTKDCENISNDLSLYKTADITQKFGKDSDGKIYYGGNGKNIDYRLVVGDLLEDWYNTDHWSRQYTHTAVSDTISSIYCHTVKSDGTSGTAYPVNLDTSKVGTTNYSNPFISSKFKSLQRDELYRFGIVFFDKNGNKSVVRWIADIRIPNQYETGFNTFNVDTTTGVKFSETGTQYKGLIVHPIGIQFNIKTLPVGAVGYQIVRCKRTNNDRATITQCVISTAMTRPNNSYCGNTANYLSPSSILMYSALYENPILEGGTNGYVENNIEDLADYFVYTQVNGKGRTCYSAFNYYNIYSPEYSYLPDTYKQYLSHSRLSILPINYIDTLNNAVQASVDDKGNTFTSAFDYYSTTAHVDSRTDTSDGTSKSSNTVRLSTTEEAGPHGYYIYSNTLRFGYNYSKLYNQATSLYKLRGDSTTLAPVTIGSTDLNPTIISLGYALEPEWNNYETRNDFISSVNGYGFNNWVRCGYGTGDNLYNDYDEYTFQGPGGRSVIAYIPFDIRNIYSDNTLTTTAGKFGTFICNIRRSIVPYGGCNAIQRSLSVYYPVSDIKTDLNCTVFNGDVFICNYDFVKVHRWHSKSTSKSLYGGCVAYSVPVETFINLTLNQGPKFAGEATKDIQIKPTNFNNEYTQEYPLYTYNTAYSQESNVNINSSENPFDEYNKVVDTRTYFSNTKSNDELIDSWSKFQPLNYLDVDTRYGQITQLRTFNNDLLYWQETAVGKFSVNERSIITDNSNNGLILGTGGVLSRYDYLATVNGMRKNDTNDCQSDNVLYWFDYDKNELCAYSGNDIICISKKFNVQNYLNDLKHNSLYKDKTSLVYDKTYNETMFSLATNGESLVFSENINAFIGIYTNSFRDATNFTSGTVLVNSNNLYNLNVSKCITGSSDKVLLPYLKYIVNSAYNYVKVFDNQEIANSLELSKLLLTFNTDKIQIKRQLSNFETDNSISFREFSYRLSVPRYSTSQIGDRYRGRVLNVTLQYTLAGCVELSYITTTFRPSLS